MTHLCVRLSGLAMISAALSVGSASAAAADSNSSLDVSTDGTLVAVSNRDAGSVTVLSLPALRKLHEVPVGHHPEGVTFLGDSHDLACAVYGDDQVVFLDVDTGAVTSRVDVFDEPYGVVCTADGSSVFVTLEFPGDVIEISGRDRTISRTISAGSFVRGIALAPDDATLFVTEYLTSNLVRIDRETGRITAVYPGNNGDNLCRQAVVHPSKERVYLPLIRSRNTVAQGAGSIFPYVTVADTSADARRPRLRIAMDSFRGTRVVANPWEIALTPDGQRLFVLFGGTNDLYAARITDDHFEMEYDTTLTLGNNPRALAVTPDGQMLLVHNGLDFDVVAYSLPDLRQVGAAQVCDQPYDDEMLLGKRLFYTAHQPMSSRKWISCASCHPDGDSDGQTWKNPEGLRQTPPLGGLAWTHPLHWSADRDESQDFEHTIRGPLMQGSGLVRGSVFDSLGKPNSGLSDGLDALARYTNSHHVPLSPFAKEGLSEAAKRGREIFLSKSVGCAECHSGPFYSDSQPRNPPLRHDVGTGMDDPGELMGPEYDTPTLLGVYRSAPYLHHGTAATLRDVLTTANPNDEHGKTSHLKDDEIDDLVAFLKCLPYEDAEQAASKQGLVKVEK